MNLKFDKLRIAAARDVLAPTSPVVSDLLDDIETLQERVRELEKVLEWYAGPAFSQTHNAAGLRQPYPILEDEGHKAREVLNKK